MNALFEPLSGRCTCSSIQYQLLAPPLCVHCCHCRWCQRETGSAFAINALIEMTQLKLLQGDPLAVELSSESGKGQRVMVCPQCHMRLWSHYLLMGDAIGFVRVGTLENPAACPPDVHIHTVSKQPWVQLGDAIPQYEAYYRRSDIWSEASIKRFFEALGQEYKPKSPN